MTEKLKTGGSYVFSGIVSLTIAGLAAYEGRNFPFQDLQEGLGAAFFPFLILGCIGALGLGQLIYGLILGFQFELPYKPSPELTALGLLFIVFVLFTLAFAKFGLIIPTIVFLIVAMRVLGASWKRSGVIGPVAGLAIYAIFVVGFNIPMP